MQGTILNKSWKQHPTKQLYSHLPPISKIIPVRPRYAGHCWRNMNKLISGVFLWAPTQRLASIGRPARIYLYQLCVNTGYSLEDLPGVMDDRDGQRERESEKSMLSV